MTKPAPEQAIEARRTAARIKESAVDKAIRQLSRTGTPIERTAVARLAGVSRSFTYENVHARAAIEAACDRSRADASRRVAERSAIEESSWRERALNAEDQLACIKRDLERQRTLVSDALAQLRDPDGTWLTAERDRRRTENEALLLERNNLASERNQTQRQLDAARSNITRLMQRLARQNQLPPRETSGEASP